LRAQFWIKKRARRERADAVLQKNSFLKMETASLRHVTSAHLAITLPPLSPSSLSLKMTF
jgi:hypothetical protein